MNARTLIRLLAYAIAIGAAIDPQIQSATPAPLAVALREPSGSLAQNLSRASAATQAAKVRARLDSAMPGALAINATAEPRAVVVVGPRLKRRRSLRAGRCPSFFPPRSRRRPCESSRSPVLDPFRRVGRRLFPRRSMGAA